MICTNCNSNTSLKETDKFISILCKCEIIILYPKKTICRISKGRYQKNFKK